MLKRILLVLALSCPVAYAVDTPPSEASIKQLLAVTEVHKLLDSWVAQMDGLMKNAMQQATQGQSVSPQIQKDIDKRVSETTSMFKEILDWNKLEPMYVRVYQKSFTQAEVDGMLAFYKTPAGQAVINKLPVVMQNTMTEMQTMMGPVMQRVQRMQRDVVAEIQAEKAKKGSG